MPSTFLSSDARRRDSWCEAFPDLLVGRLEQFPSGAGPVWLLLPVGKQAAATIGRLRKELAGRPLIVLADEPSEEGAMAALAAGADGVQVHSAFAELGAACLPPLLAGFAEAQPSMRR